jgi:hypothetical protein
MTPTVGVSTLAIMKIKSSYHILIASVLNGLNSSDFCGLKSSVVDRGQRYARAAREEASVALPSIREARMRVPFDVKLRLVFGFSRRHRGRFTVSLSERPARLRAAGC